MLCNTSVKFDNFLLQSQGDIGPAGPPGNATYQQNRSPYGPPVSAEAACIGHNLGITFKCHLSQQSETWHSIL